MSNGGLSRGGTQCFQFIGFPSEWGVGTGGVTSLLSPVSNLLGSPASGETTSARQRLLKPTSFQFIGFPSEWGDCAWDFPGEVVAP